MQFPSENQTGINLTKFTKSEEQNQKNQKKVSCEVGEALGDLGQVHMGLCKAVSQGLSVYSH